MDTSRRDALRAGLCERISSDPAKLGRGIARQDEDCLALARRCGYAVAEDATYADNDISGFKGKVRPQWERLKADVSSGRLDVVVAWSIDRLGRSVRELLEFFDLCAGHGVIIHTCKEGHLDPASPVGRLIATILAAVAQMESERKAERVKRHHEQKADAGGRQWAGRTFGYDVSYDDPDRPHRRIVAVAVNPGEADVIRDSAARVLAGESLSSVCRDLGACGVRTVSGVTFTPDTLKIVLCAARISGRREYVGRGNGSRHRRMGEITADGDWPAIITAAQSDRLREMFASRFRPEHAGAPKYLLSGLLSCGKPDCGAPMYRRDSTDKRRPNQQTRYQCKQLSRRQQEGGYMSGCGGTSIVAGKVEDLVRDAVLEALNSADFARIAGQADEANGPVLEEISAVDGRLAELAADHAVGLIDRKTYASGRDAGNARREMLTRQLKRSQASSALADWFEMGGALRQRWDAAGTDRQRALVRALTTKITVRPGRGEPADRVVIEWRT